MFLDIDNESRKPLLEEIAASAIVYAKSKLLPRIRTLEIDVLIRPFDPKDDSVGYCLCEDDHKNPRHFSIEVNSKQSLEAFVQTILHEMVHVKQYAYNELNYKYEASKSKWLSIWNGKDLTHLPYADQPWEVEALEMEKVLYDGFLSSRWDEFHNYKR